MNAVPLAHNVIIRLIKGCKWSGANEAWKCLLLVDIVSPPCFYRPSCWLCIVVASRCVELNLKRNRPRRYRRRLSGFEARAPNIAPPDYQSRAYMLLPVVVSALSSPDVR